MPATPPDAVADAVAPLLDSIAEQLAAALASRDLAPTTAARHASIDPAVLRLFLTRDRKSVQIKALLRACAANGIPVEVRIGGPEATS